MDKFNLQVILGSFCNIVVIGACIFIPDYLLLKISIFLFLITMLSGYLYNRTNHIHFGVHLMLLIYVIVFTIAAFTHLVHYPLILVYPIVIGLSHLYFESNHIRISYLIVCAIGVLVLTASTQFQINGQIMAIELLSQIAVGIGLLTSFYFISITHINIINSYQTKLKAKEITLLDKKDQLESYIESNLQLENFAHLASHELKTPIRNISNFTGLLQMRLKEKLSSNETEMLDIVNNEAIRMNLLISDLLELSKVTNGELEVKKIYFPNFLEIMINKYFKENKQGIILMTTPFTIYANKTHLELLFFNLIHNAIKFTKAGTTPKVVINHHNLEEFHSFAIHDNGIGIDPTLREQIFLIFKRLHNYGEFEGTGMGLAICKKIIERHEGDISVDSSELGGSVFKFTISKSLNRSYIKPDTKLRRVSNL